MHTENNSKTHTMV